MGFCPDVFIKKIKWMNFLEGRFVERNIPIGIFFCKTSKMPKAAETRIFIIEKTAPLFNKKGFVGTSLSDMEKATGLTKGSIYNSFANKDEVAIAVFDHNLQLVNDLISKEMAQYISAKDQLLVYAKVYGQDFLKSPFPEGGCPILNTAIEADDTHPELRKKAHEALLIWKDNIETIIKRGIKNEEFRANINPEDIALAIIASIEGGIMMTKISGKLHYLKSIMRSIEKTIQDLT